MKEIESVFHFGSRKVHQKKEHMNMRRRTVLTRNQTKLGSPCRSSEMSYRRRMNSKLSSSCCRRSWPTTKGSWFLLLQFVNSLLFAKNINTFPPALVCQRGAVWRWDLLTCLRTISTTESQSERTPWVWDQAIVSHFFYKTWQCSILPNPHTYAYIPYAEFQVCL